MDLVFLTRLLQLATGCRAMLRSRKYSFPPADPELLHTFYPVLTSCILEVQLRDEDDVSGMSPLWPLSSVTNYIRLRVELCEQKTNSILMLDWV